MKLRAKMIIPVLLAVFLMLCSSSVVFAAELKVGSVKGLPEKLVVLDDNGRSVSENGEYYFHVNDMQQGETYTKKIQIMNLREDAKYRLYFSAQPHEKFGEIDLERDCTCVIYLDDKEVYTGKVTGEGTPDIRENAMDLGMYEPGESHILRVDVVWIDTGSGGHIDYGARLVDSSGTKILRDESGKKEIYGEVTFKWLFTAAIVSDIDPSKPESSGDTDISEPTESQPSKPSPTPDIPDVINTGDTIAMIIFGLVAVATLFLIILVLGKKKKKKKE